jgi:hypothetical protein
MRPVSAATVTMIVLAVIDSAWQAASRKTLRREFASVIAAGGRFGQRPTKSLYARRRRNGKFVRRQAALTIFPKLGDIHLFI